MHQIDDVCTVLAPNTLCWARAIDAPPARIWTALTEPAELAVWFMEAQVDLRMGGEVWFHPDAPFGGTIVQLDPPRVLEIDQGSGFLRFEVAPDRVAFIDRMRDGTTPSGEPGTVANRQPGGPGTHWAGVAAGWHNFLDALAAHVTGEPIPSFATYEALIPPYADWLDARLNPASESSA